MLSTKSFGLISLLATASLINAADIWVQVGANSSSSESVFDPQIITASLGDIVFFNFTDGNHTVTQSVFASPCTPANIANNTINGFDSGFIAVNGTPSSGFNIPITPQIENVTQWFYDYNTCGVGGVGAINVNDSSWENFDGFERNALRLNGSEASSSSSSSRTSSSSSPTSSSNSGSDDSDGAERAAAFGGALALPLVLLAIAGYF